MDYESQRKLIIIFILAVVLTIIIAITVLVFIWLPDDENENEEQEYVVGKIEQQSSTEEAIVEKYYKQLFALFLNADTDSIYDLVGKDYLEYFDYDKQDIIDFLREKSILSRGLELIQYKSYSLPGYSSVYEFDLKVKDEAYSINVVVREKSPNNYTLAFDKFIDCMENTYSSTKDSIKLDIYKQVRYTNSVQYEIKLTNNYNKNIKVNSGDTGNPIILVNSQSEARRPIMTTLSATEMTVEPEQYRTFTAVFDIEETYDYYTYNILVLKNVGFDGIQGTNNLEFTLN